MVVAIIMILAGLLFPAIRGALKRAKYAQAQTDCNSLANAINQYVTEYGKLPVADSMQGKSAYDDKNYAYGYLPWDGNSVNYQAYLCNTLRAIANTGEWNANHALNLKRIVFFEPPGRKGAVVNGAFYDPWGMPYVLYIDTLYDKIDMYGDVKAFPAIVLSMGPNKILDWQATVQPGDDVWSAPWHGK